MKIKYIGHSGFSVELNQSILLFDYFKGTIPEFSAKKHIYVFSSHFHRDHFNMEIFKLAKKYPSITYILSYDIGKKYNRRFFLRHDVSPELYDRIIFLPENTAETIDFLEIQTLHSTDEGVAFLVKTEDKTIFHSGDLHWWTWPGETPEEYRQMTDDYQKEIAELADTSLDAAFLVLDPRQEKNFYLGFDYFMRHTDTKLAYPMHFWKDSSVIDQLLRMDVSKDYRDRIVGTAFYTSNH